MKNYSILFFLLLSTCVFAQPSNDVCSNATNIGTLPLGVGSCFIGNNTGANPEFPYPFQTSCSGSSFQDWPAADVWYSFVAPAGANELRVQISGDLVNPNLALYRGTCGNLIGTGCGSYNSFGVFTIAPLTPGLTYYVQVSGGNETDLGEFQMCLTPRENPDICIAATNYTVSPPPVNGYFEPGQTVTFCFAVTEFVQQAVNYFHGISITPGPGYVPNSLTPVSFPTTSCSGTGNWGFYNSINSSFNVGVSAGPGFYFDSRAGTSNGLPFLDGNPGNNWGDGPCTNFNWNFCWTLQIPNYADVPSCLQAPQDLSVSIETWADGEIGSWTSPSCNADPSIFSSNVLQCCPQPITTSTPPNCNGPCTGEATAIGTGVDPHTYLWANGATTSTITGLCAGNYNVTVTDFNNCETFATVTVDPTIPLTLNGSSTNVTCFGANNGRAIVSTNGGAAPFNYSWNNGITVNNDTVNNLAPGSYIVTVTDAGGCTATRSYTITQPTQIITTLVDSQSVSCFGAADGAIDINVTGGQPNYTYLWNNNATTQDLQNIISGNYTVIVRDAASCRDTFSITITDANAVAINTFVDSISCGGRTDGAISVDITGGAGGYTFLWNNNSTANSIGNLGTGNYSVTINDANNCSAALTFTLSAPAPIGIAFITDSLGCNLYNVDVTISGGEQPYSFIWSTVDSTEDIGPVFAGSYLLTVTDANGCSNTQSITVVNNNPSVVINISFTKTDESCFGATDASIDATITGGALPNTYLWSNGFTTEDIDSITSGNYILTVTDANGCFDIDSIAVNAAQAINAIALTDTINCYGDSTGNVILNVSGGASPLNILWSNGDTTADLTNVPAGNYSVIITDANGCTDSLSINVPQKTLLQAALTTRDNICFNYNDGFASVSVAGGTLPYNIEWSNGSTDNEILNLRHGDYTLTVNDANSCDTIIVFTIARADTIGLQLPDSLRIDFTDSIQIDLEYLIQNGDSVLFSWSPTNELTCNDCATPTAYPYVSGNYIVTMNVEGCLYYDTVFIEVGPASIFMPNAFSPNGDGVNDILVPITFGAKAYQMTIFDRWGEKIFESNDLSIGWDGLYDGNELPNGVYVYFVYIRFLDDSEKTLKGSITIVK